MQLLIIKFRKMNWPSRIWRILKLLLCVRESLAGLSGELPLPLLLGFQLVASCVCKKSDSRRIGPNAADFSARRSIGTSVSKSTIFVMTNPQNIHLAKTGPLPGCWGFDESSTPMSPFAPALETKCACPQLEDTKQETPARSSQTLRSSGMGIVYVMELVAPRLWVAAIQTMIPLFQLANASRIGPYQSWMLLINFTSIISGLIVFLIGCWWYFHSCGSHLLFPFTWSPATWSYGLMVGGSR